MVIKKFFFSFSEHFIEMQSYSFFYLTMPGFNFIKSGVWNKKNKQHFMNYYITS